MENRSRPEVQLRAAMRAVEAMWPGRDPRRGTDRAKAAELLGQGLLRSDGWDLAAGGGRLGLRFVARRDGSLEATSLGDPGSGAWKTARPALSGTAGPAGRAGPGAMAMRPTGEAPHTDGGTYRLAAMLRAAAGAGPEAPIAGMAEALLTAAPEAYPREMLRAAARLARHTGDARWPDDAAACRPGGWTRGQLAARGATGPGADPGLHTLRGEGCGIAWEVGRDGVAHIRTARGGPEGLRAMAERDVPGRGGTARIRAAPGEPEGRGRRTPRADAPRGGGHTDADVARLDRAVRAVYGPLEGDVPGMRGALEGAAREPLPAAQLATAARLARARGHAWAPDEAEAARPEGWTEAELARRAADPPGGGGDGAPAAGPRVQGDLHILHRDDGTGPGASGGTLAAWRVGPDGGVRAEVWAYRGRGEGRAVAGTAGPAGAALDPGCLAPGPGTYGPGEAGEAARLLRAALGPGGADAPVPLEREVRASARGEHPAPGAGDARGATPAPGAGARAGDAAFPGPRGLPDVPGLTRLGTPRALLAEMARTGGARAGGMLAPAERALLGECLAGRAAAFRAGPPDGDGTILAVDAGGRHPRLLGPGDGPGAALARSLAPRLAGPPLDPDARRGPDARRDPAPATRGR